jgi:hypothetical protein
MKTLHIIIKIRYGFITDFKPLSLRERGWGEAVTSRIHSCCERGRLNQLANIMMMGNGNDNRKLYI